MNKSTHIKEQFDAAVRIGRRIAKEEQILRDAEHALRKSNWELRAIKEGLLSLLPKSENTQVRLSFALSCTSTAQEILESLASQSVEGSKETAGS